MPLIKLITIAALALVAGELRAGQSDRTLDQATGIAQAPGSPLAVSAPGDVSIAIEDGRFSPEWVTVPSGARVTWTNRDSVQHTVSRPLERGIQAVGPDSAPLNHGDSYSFIYDAIGLFPYHCKIHPSMQGTVEVTRP